jgi:hypothetical protein
MSIVVASCLVIESVQAIKRLVGPGQFEVGMDGCGWAQGCLGVTGLR